MTSFAVLSLADASLADWIGSLGVALLLLAFFLNATGRLAPRSAHYHVLNAVGAALAGWASWQIGFLPFVVLEAVWCAVALAALVRLREAER
jgi:hypothetical protein